MLGVQWHPEDTAAARSVRSKPIFDGFALLSKWHGSRAKPGETQGRPASTASVDYDPDLAGAVRRRGRRIRDALGDLAVRIDHVGSTSVPGLAAKPVIDIQVSVASLIPRAPVVDPLVAAGYRHSIDPIETEHEFLSMGYDDDAADGAHPRVRSRQRVGTAAPRVPRRAPTRSEPAAEYAALKRQLAAEHPRDIQTYVDGKTAFIRSIEERALAET